MLRVGEGCGRGLQGEWNDISLVFARRRDCAQVLRLQEAEDDYDEILVWTIFLSCCCMISTLIFFRLRWRESGGIRCMGHFLLLHLACFFSTSVAFRISIPAPVLAKQLIAFASPRGGRVLGVG